MQFWPNGTDGLDRRRLESVIKTQAAIGAIKPDKTPVTYERLVDASVSKDTVTLTKAR